ncbi:MAG: RpiR family carbohydrate utilization transcriptional regulator [Candidatus Azotimanducaceae bacterium]|jgi:RpiR family carbohydrate utilization transcriptional regulator
MSILTQLKTQMQDLSKAELSIAEAILLDVDAAVQMTTADLARLAGVSDPMVSRFCRRLGCSSFPDFKVQLAKSVVTESAFISSAVSPGDDAALYIEKRISANQSALEYIRGKLEPDVIDSAVRLLEQSKRIEIFGMGASAAIAQDAQDKLFRFGKPTGAYVDHLMQRMVAAAADEETTFILFSFTGRTREMIEIAHIARGSNAKIIAITHPGSPLSKLAHVSITSGDELEDTTIYVPMTVRIIVLTIVDILATGLALAQGSRLDSHWMRIKASVDSTKVEDS